MDITKQLFWVANACFYMKLDGFTVFIDPFNVGRNVHEKADLILITHAHPDHSSPADIKKVAKPETEIVCSEGCLSEADFKNFKVIKPGDSMDYKGIRIDTIPAYNVKPERMKFHPKDNNWVGYILDINGFKLFHAGDTDFIDEMKTLKNMGASLLPMGGTYTMDVNEAIEAANAIDAQHSVPMHYRGQLGAKAAEAEELFKSKVKNARIMKEV